MAGAPQLRTNHILKMQLKNQVEWVIHCCAVLAALEPGRYMSTKLLAEFHGVPKEYLSKALQGLSQAELVESTLGPTGGYRLARPAEEISFLQIVEAVEGRSPSFVCTEIRKNNPCRDAGQCDRGPCPVARVMWEADRAWRNHLGGVSLADLGKRLEAEIPAELLERSYQWLANAGKS